MKHHSPRFLKLVEETRKRIREISIPEVREKLRRKESFHLVDVREESEWALGRIEGAISIGRGVLERDIEEKIPDFNAPIVLYCGGGFRSALAADNLTKMGYKNVLSMNGGWRGWVESRG